MPAAIGSCRGHCLSGCMQVSRTHGTYHMAHTDITCHISHTSHNLNKPNPTKGFSGVDCSIQHIALPFDQPLTRPPSFFEYAHFTVPRLDPRLANRSIRVDVQASYEYGGNTGTAAVHSLSRPELLLLQV